MTDSSHSTPPPLTAIDYASPSLNSGMATEPQPLRRYSVYGFDELSQRAVRVRVDAYGLPNLYAQLRRSQLMAEFIADDPGDHDEAPPIEHWHADADAHAPPEFAKRLRRMSSTGYGGYAPMPHLRVAVGDEENTASPTRGIILRLPEGYTIASGRFPQRGAGYRQMFVWGVAAGIIDVVLGGVGLGAVLMFMRGVGTTTWILTIAITLTFIIPGIAFILLGAFARTVHRPWLPIVGLTIVTLFCLLMIVSLFGQTRSPNPDLVGLAMTLGLLALHLGLLVQCVRAILHGPPIARRSR